VEPPRLPRLRHVRAAQVSLACGSVNPCHTSVVAESTSQLISSEVYHLTTLYSAPSTTRTDGRASQLAIPFSAHLRSAKNVFAGARRPEWSRMGRRLARKANEQ
jgi:hypothetical protein